MASSKKRPEPKSKKAGARETAPRPSLVWEERAGYPMHRVAGVDEVGRGCLAGPVVAAAVVLPIKFEFRPGFCAPEWLADVRDSKLLNQEARERLSPLIQSFALAWSIGEASLEEIDRLNIYHATHLAMSRALAGLGEAFSAHHVLVDGNVLPKGLPCPGTAIVKGDQHSLSIASASILAKVHRDRLMAELESQHPGYGFAENKGYGTPAHLEALKNRGPSPVHRKGFSPIAEMLAKLKSASSESATEAPQLALL